jgi:hypothetical protein
MFWPYHDGAPRRASAGCFAAGCKLAAQPIALRAQVLKYGEAIGKAARDIAVGGMRMGTTWLRATIWVL